MNNSPTIKKGKRECEVCHCGHEGHDCPVHKPSEEKDQYGHKIIRPTLPDDTFEGLKEEIKERVSEEKECICTNVIGTTINPDCSIHGITPKQEDWEEELELLFCKPWGTKEVKSFISQLLKKEREKVIEEIDSWLKKDSEGTWELEGLYMRFKDYLRKLKK